MGKSVSKRPFSMPLKQMAILIKMLDGRIMTLKSPLNIFFQLWSWIFSASAEGFPLVHGINFSPGRSLKHIGTNIKKAKARDKNGIAVENPNRFISDVPTTSVIETPMVLEPHIKPFARAFSLFGTISTAIPSVATS